MTHMAMKTEVILILSSEQLLGPVTENSLRHAHFIFDFRCLTAFVTGPGTYTLLGPHGLTEKLRWGS